jgi:hypothetical protein
VSWIKNKNSNQNTCSQSTTTLIEVFIWEALSFQSQHAMWRKLHQSIIIIIIVVAVVVGTMNHGFEVQQVQQQFANFVKLVLDQTASIVDLFSQTGTLTFGQPE